jgi:hypothetical protein
VETDKKRVKKPLSEKRDALAKSASDLDRAARLASRKEVPTTEQSFQKEYARMLRYNSRLIRRMNEALEGNLVARDVYALSTLMSQQREVINDLRAIADLSQQVGLIHDAAVNPFMSDLTQLVTDVYYQIRKLIAETVKPKDAEFANKQLDELIKQMGLGIQAGNAKLRQSISDILAGPPQKETVKKNKVRR